MTEPATNLDFINVSILPPNTRKIIAAVGLPAAFNLFRAKGGTWVYVPHIATRSQLLDVLTKEQLQQLAQVFGGQSILIPMVDKMLAQLRKAAIRVDIKSMNSNEVARKYGICRRRVEQICAEDEGSLLPKIADNNLSLF